MCVESKPERPRSVQTRADTLLHYFDSRPRTTSRPEQTASQQNLWSDKRKGIFSLSRDRHAVQQIISECAPTLSGLLDIVSQSMRHDCDSHRLNIFRENHVAPVHQRPGLGRMQQSESRARGQAGTVTLSRSIEQILQVIEQRWRSVHLSHAILNFEQCLWIKHRLQFFEHLAAIHAQKHGALAGSI